MHAEFLLELIPLLPGFRRGIYLETNGSLPRELSRIIHLVDLVAMDIKLPGTAGLPPLWKKHREFLAVARQKQVLVKIVVDEGTDPEELNRAVDLIQEGGEVPLVIQPATRADGRPGIAPGRLLLLQEHALGFLSDVRVIPQVHKMLGVL